MNCALCHQALPVYLFPGAIPEVQRVFTVARNGDKVHVPPCPAAPNYPAIDTGD